MTSNERVEARRSLDFSKRLGETGWYHSMEFPDGTSVKGHHSLEDLRNRYAQFGLPDDLTGKTLLDIGAWDGWFSFEAERRGAQVVALDCWESPNFLYAHRKLGSSVRYVIAEVYQIDQLGLGQFDFVLFLGVIYHLRHPLLALEKVCALTRQTAIIDSFIVEDVAEGALPCMEFYETTELGNNIDNWCGPSLECLLAFCRSAGFARANLLGIEHSHARIRCDRKWDSIAGNEQLARPILRDAINNRNSGINFTTGKEEYLTCWFRYETDSLTRPDVFPEVGGFGTIPLFLREDSPHEWVCNVIFPPGLSAGWHDVSIRAQRSAYSNAIGVAVDLELGNTIPVIVGVFDAQTWKTSEIDQQSEYLCLWISGLSSNSDRSNVRAFIDEQPQTTVYVGPEEPSGSRQVNIDLQGQSRPGSRSLVISHGRNSSQPYMLTIAAS